MSKKQLGRPLAHPDGVKKSYSVSLNNYQAERIKNKYGSLTNALEEVDKKIITNIVVDKSVTYLFERAFKEL